MSVARDAIAQNMYAFPNRPLFRRSESPPMSITTDEMYQCAQCSYESAWVFDMDHHVQRRHHNVYAVELFDAIRRPEQYLCTWCNFKTRHKLKLYEHCKLTHTTTDATNDTSCWCDYSDCLYRCDQCKYKTYAGLLVVKHFDRCNAKKLRRRKVLAKSKVSCDSPNKDDLENLSRFLLSLPQSELLQSKDQNILRARAAVAYYRRSFHELYAILQSRTFDPQWHKELQAFWFNAHYDEAQMIRNKPLGPVDKFRIRKKFPLPKTIWDGEETLYCFNKQSRVLLKKCYLARPFPTPDEKRALSERTGLSQLQIANWYKNRRQRDRQSQSQRLRKAAYPSILKEALSMKLGTFKPLTPTIDVGEKIN